MSLFLRQSVFPHALRRLDVVNPQAWRLTGVGKTPYNAFIMKLNFLVFMCLRTPHVTAPSFSHSYLVPAYCFLCPTAVAIRLIFSRRRISSKTIFLWFIVDSLDHQSYGWKPRPALPFTTVLFIYFHLKANSTFSTSIFAFHYRPVITKGWTFFTSVSRESWSI